MSANVGGAAAAAAASDAPIQQQSAAILKLDIDCFEEIFDYLPMTDLISIGKTCKRLNRFAGYIFQQNFSHLQIFCRNDHFLIELRHQADHFVQFFQNLTILSEDDLDFYLGLPSKLHQHKHIYLKNIDISLSVDRKFEIFGKLESLRLYYFKINGCFHSNILAACPNLKHLSLSGYSPDSNIIGRGNEWLLRNYPTLEHLELNLHNKFQVDHLKDFLELNPNLRKFSAFTILFWENRDAILKADVKLDELAVCAIFEGTKDFMPLMDMLNRLHERGFYKRLEFSHNCTNQKLIDQLAFVQGLVKLYLLYGENIRLKALNSIEELFYENSVKIIDLEEIATNLTKLERIHFVTGHPEHIAMLIRRAAHLKRIIVNNYTHLTPDQRMLLNFNRCAQNNKVIIDLRALNEERGKMTGARKVTVFVEEQVYLATKWALKETNFELVRLMRLGAIDCVYPWD